MLCFLFVCSSAEAEVISLLHMDGPNGSTTFTDEAGGTWAASGSTQISTAQNKFGGASGAFAGYLENSDYNALELGATTPFTIDFWVYLNATASHTYLVGKSNPDAGRGYDIRAEGTRLAVYGVNGWTPGVFSGSDLIDTQTWYHVAMTGTESNIYLFLDGNLQATSVRNINSNLATDRGFRLGAQANFGGNPLNGYIDEFRFVSGEAMWTDDFTPPTAPYAIPEPTAATLLLLGGLGLAARRRRR